MHSKSVFFRRGYCSLGVDVILLITLHVLKGKDGISMSLVAPNLDLNIKMKFVIDPYIISSMFVSKVLYKVLLKRATAFIFSNKSGNCSKCSK